MKVVNTSGIVDRALGPDPLTDDALALRFSQCHGDDLRYLAAKGTWFRWDGNRWRPESTLLAYDLARENCREAAREYGNGAAPTRVYSAKTVSAVEVMARADRHHATTIEQWDTNPLIFNARGETIDLRTGKCYAPRREDYITKLAGTAYAKPGTQHPRWSAFLERIAPDPELRAFLQRYVGYCMTGSVIEHKFVFAYGTGGNGKGTFTETIMKIMGDHATVADMGTFIAANQERHPTDVAKLHGARFAVASETQQGRQWDEAKIKLMTGGDKLTGRFMRQDFFDYDPTHKLWIVGNHKPRLKNVDEAMRRRLLLVPFQVKVPEKERDLRLGQKLRTEWPAILRWCVDGCLEWQRIGLAPPKIVTDATNDYFEDQDLVGQWLAERAQDGGPHAFTLTSQLFGSWKLWCDERSLNAGSSHAFSETLTDRGFAWKRAHGGARGFISLVLK
jgi:putative DNA primase/helicase